MSKILIRANPSTSVTNSVQLLYGLATVSTSRHAQVFHFPCITQERFRAEQHNASMRFTLLPCTSLCSIPRATDTSWVHARPSLKDISWHGFGEANAYRHLHQATVGCPLLRSALSFSKPFLCTELPITYRVEPDMNMQVCSDNCCNEFSLAYPCNS